jgi:CheY-like chemotaxis protein
MPNARNNALPLFRRPGRVALLDDDIEFLEFLEGVLRPRWSVSAFSVAEDFSEAVRQQAPFWEADAWHQQEVVRGWREGRSSLAAEVVCYWARHTERYGLIRVSLVDQMLPGTTGLDVLRALPEARGAAVLLTGRAGDSVAVAGFNERLIQRFEQKQGAPLYPRIVDLVQELQDQSDTRLDQIWRSTLTAQQDAALRQPEVARGLGEVLRMRMTEYVVLGAPFGALGLTSEGRLAWLGLQLAGDEGALDDTAIRRDLGLAPAAPGGASEPFVFGAAGQVRGRLFIIPERLGRAHPVGYTDWLLRQGPRVHA